MPQPRGRTTLCGGRFLDRGLNPTFTQEDPIGLAGGLNLYGFAQGDPVNFSDPFGLCPPIELCRLLLDMTATGAKAEGLARIIDRGVLWQEVRSGGTRSWRNNNSGNISAGGFATHQGAVGDDGRFAIFAARSAGDGAKLTLLRSSSYAELTLDAAIARWAPEGENPTAAYQAFVGSQTGIAGGTVLNELTDEQLTRVADAMRRFEGWREGTVELRIRR